MSLINSVSDKRMIIYVVIVIVCIIIIGVSVYFHFFYSNEKPSLLINVDGTTISADTEYERLKTGFNSRFSNSVIKDKQSVENVLKMDNTKDLVYTMYEIKLYSENKFDININIPAININSDVAKKINTEIDNIFGSKANSVVQSKEALSIYNIDYVAYLNGNILSLVIKATLKELDYQQRVIIKTYNYNIATNEEVSLQTLMTRKNLDRNYVYNKIIKEIDEVNFHNEALAKVGYDILIRDRNDSRYEIENTDTFFIDTNDYLYLIYAYGNNTFTSEMDIIIFN